MISQRSNYESIVSHLRSNDFHFSEAWLIECVNNVKAANPSITFEALKNEVKQRWLLLDLRDVKVPSLPPDLKSKKEVIISGNYAVQVESMIDSSRSCYSQFQKMLNVDPDNIKTEEESDKSKRCLTFLISDGAQELQAMEYEIIKKIRTNDDSLRPGFKMVIMGPVECRKGMILLKDRNVRLCGGWVDALLIRNSLRNILIRRLELDAADYPEITGGDASVKVAQPPQNESVDNFGNEFVNSLLSQDDDVFFNVPLQPVNQQTQPQERFSVNNERSDSLSTVPHGDTSTSGRISTDSALGNSGTSLCPTQELIPVDDDGDVFIEDFYELPPKIQKRDPKSKKPVQTKLSSFFRNSECGLNSANRTLCENKTTNFVSDKPFVYLKHIMAVKLSKPTAFMIKAIILTLKKKLTIEKDEYKLRAHITDGSYSIDVDFCSEILEDFLGYSPCEMTVMVKAKQTNSAIAQRVKESFAKAQEKLISLNCLMEIKFFTDGQSPVILSLQEVTAQTLSTLKQRMHYQI